MNNNEEALAKVYCQGKQDQLTKVIQILDNWIEKTFDNKNNQIVCTKHSTLSELKEYLFNALQSTYRPFNSKEEISLAIKQHGYEVSDSTYSYTIIAINDDNVSLEFFNRNFAYRDCKNISFTDLSKYHFNDGTPCGIQV